MASVTVRVDDETKARAAEIADFFGFDLSSVTRAFYKQMVRENRIPLNLSEREPNEESLEALAEADEFFASGKKPRFKNTQEMFAALDI
ncbi:MAG: type II toxin-antitoxin system RelB/DinJ family antitoxin [Microbacteriaceae bacterium]|nr:type II toxin-antitoxin system RelB/DinJ family antitoxin [Microbacteriaceae bacterium]